MLVEDPVASIRWAEGAYKVKSNDPMPKTKSKAVELFGARNEYEPDPKDHLFVREGMMNIRGAAPRLTRFIAEHQPGPNILDVSKISCTIFHRVEPAVVAELSRQGRRNAGWPFTDNSNS